MGLIAEIKAAIGLNVPSDLQLKGTVLGLDAESVLAVGRDDGPILGGGGIILAFEFPVALKDFGTLVDFIQPFFQRLFLGGRQRRFVSRLFLSDRKDGPFGNLFGMVGR